MFFARAPPPGQYAKGRRDRPEKLVRPISGWNFYVESFG
jgi:hypothetical protein